MLGTSINSYDLGAVVLIFFIAAGLLKLLTYVVKQRFEEKKGEPCKAFENKSCPIADKWENLEKLIIKIYDIHCGPQAVGENGVPRWYFSERVVQKIEDMKKIIEEMNIIHSSHSKDTKELNLKTINSIIDVVRKIREADESPTQKTKRTAKKVQIQEDPK